MNLILFGSPLILFSVLQLLLGFFLKIDLYELARVKNYGVETPCEASRLWPSNIFEIQFTCDPLLASVEGNLRIRKFPSTSWSLHEKVRIQK